MPAELKKIDLQDHHMTDPWYAHGKAKIASNHMEGTFHVSQNWNEISARLEGANAKGKNFHFKDAWDFEGDLLYRRWLNNWANLIAGGTTYGERVHAVVGVGYFLPMMIETNFLVNHEGQFRLDVQRKFQWAKNIFSDLDFTWRPGHQHGAHTAELEFSLLYAPNWAWSGGLMLKNGSLGAGVEYQF
jgi:hypothetical protein